MDIALSSPWPRAARAHALENCLAVNRLLESDVNERSRERLARSQEAVDRMLAIIQEELALSMISHRAGLALTIVAQRRLVVRHCSRKDGGKYAKQLATRVRLRAP